MVINVQLRKLSQAQTIQQTNTNAMYYHGQINQTINQTELIHKIWIQQINIPWPHLQIEETYKKFQ